MKEMKKEWTTPTLTKVKLEFDKEMSTNCSGSSNSSKNKCQQPSGQGCWANPNFGGGNKP